VYENSKITFSKNEVGMSEFSRTTDKSFAAPKNTKEEIVEPDHGEQHNGILKNFVAAVLDGAPLVAPMVEGIHSVELANAMLFSSFKQKTVDVPLDAKAYARHLKGLIKTSKFVKQEVRPATNADMSASFGK
jgi:hypothetical protein